MDVQILVEQNVQAFVEDPVLVDVLDVVDVEVIVLLHVLQLARQGVVMDALEVVVRTVPLHVLHLVR